MELKLSAHRSLIESCVVDGPEEGPKVGPDLHCQLTLFPRHGCYFRSYFFLLVGSNFNHHFRDDFGIREQALL